MFETLTPLLGEELNHAWSPGTGQSGAALAEQLAHWDVLSTDRALCVAPGGLLPSRWGPYRDGDVEVDTGAVSMPTIRSTSSAAE